MSQSLIIAGTYRNNKTEAIGLFNPHNNRVANKEERTHLNKMFKKYIDPNRPKFRKMEIWLTRQNGFAFKINYSFKSLLFCYRLLLNDK